MIFTGKRVRILGYGEFLFFCCDNLLHVDPSFDISQLLYFMYLEVYTHWQIFI